MVLYLMVGRSLNISTKVEGSTNVTIFFIGASGKSTCFTTAQLTKVDPKSEIEIVFLILRC